MLLSTNFLLLIICTKMHHGPAVLKLTMGIILNLKHIYIKNTIKLETVVSYEQNAHLANYFRDAQGSVYLLQGDDVGRVEQRIQLIEKSPLIARALRAGQGTQ